MMDFFPANDTDSIFSCAKMIIFGSQIIFDVTYGSDLYIAVDGSPGVVLTSSDGITWTITVVANGNSEIISDIIV